MFERPPTIGRNIYLACLVSLSVFSISLGNDTVAEWRFSREHVRGEMVNAVSGTLTAKFVGGAKLDPTAPSSVLLDGNSSRLLVSDDLEAAKLPRKSITVEAWVKVDRTQEWGGIVSAIQDNGSYERGWLLGFRKSNFCFGITGERRKRITYLTAKDSFAPGSWYHVVGTYDGREMRIFVDGALVTASKEQSGDILYPPKGIFVIGAYQDDNELYPTKGRIARVAVLRNAISAANVKQRFDASKSQFPEIEGAVQEVVGWPTFMRDNSRSGYTPDELAMPLKELWRYYARHKPQPAWPPPADQDFWHNKYGLKARVTFDRAYHVVSDGRSVYFGSSADDKVVCLDLSTGKPRWDYFTEGAVRLAPTVVDGRVYVGSDDGAVYCLKAENGTLLWKHQAILPQRRIPGNSRMMSVWPVRTGVMIEGGMARFAAGLFPTQGTYQFAVDADTGELSAKGELTISPQGYLERTAGGITVSRGRSPKAMMASLEQKIRRKGVVLGDLAKEYPYALVGAGDLRLAGGDGRVAAISARDGSKVWEGEVEGAAHSLAVAEGRLLVSTDQGVIHCFGPADERAHGVIDDRVTESPQTEISAESRAHAAHILSSVEINKGYGLVVGCRDGQLALELARQSQLMLVIVEPDEELLNKLRRTFDQAGLYGRVVIHRQPSGQLPYADVLFNLIVSEEPLSGEPFSIPAKEVHRLLRPGGGAAIFREVAADKSSNQSDAVSNWLEPASNAGWNVERSEGWLTAIRKPLANVGSWTHMYSDPSNTACSGDQRVGGKLGLQWFGPPGPQQMLDRHHRTVPPLAVDGRLFIPGDNRVVAVDAYNGTILWNREVTNSRRVGVMRDAGSMSASNDLFYVVAEDRCLGLSTRSGRTDLDMQVPQMDDDKPRHWGYVSYVGSQLFGSTTKPGASRGGHSRGQISEIYYDHVPVVTSDSIFSSDRHKGELSWHYQSRCGAIVNPTITVGNGRVYFVESRNADTLTVASGRSKQAALLSKGADLVALDANTGELVWRQPVDLSAIQHHLYLCYSDGMLVIVGTKNKGTGKQATVWYDLHGFKADSGKRVWSETQNQRQQAGGSHGEQDHHPAIVKGVVYQEPYAYDLHTGKRKADWRFVRGGHGCGTIAASDSAFFFRAGNPTMCDLATGKNSKVTKVSRPGCWINIIPAGGLLLIPEASSGCTCDFPIQSSMALIPIGD